MKRTAFTRSSKLATGIALLTAALLVSACTSNDSNKPANPATETPGIENSQAPDTNAPKVDLTDGAGIVDPNVATQEGENTEGSTAKPDNGNTDPSNEPSTSGNNDADPASEEGVIKQEKGTFVGLADSHTLEITTATDNYPLQFDSSLAQQLNELEPDAEVTFEYVYKNGQQWLVSITPQ